MTKIAAISVQATQDKQKNVAEALKYVRAAAEAGAQWVLLPEVFAYNGPYDASYTHAEEEGGPLYLQLSQTASELRIHLFAGSYGERSENKNERRVYNTMYVFNPEGKCIAKYRKTHLFNLISEDNRPLYCESDGVLSGDKIVTLKVGEFQVGLAICYDLRFGGLFHKMAQSAPLDVLVIPSAFTKKTGEAHWELLLRARAVEFQCYVYAANQTGVHGPGKESYGHSMIVDPWGDVLGDSGDKPGFVCADISTARIQQVRSQLPAIKNRRPELY